MRDSLSGTAEALYRQYHRDLVRFFAEQLSDRDAAWDLCHEVFVRLLITLAAGTVVSHPHQWLMRVARNLLVDTYRHQHAASTPIPLSRLPEQALFTSDPTTFWTLLERADLLQVIAETFRALPERYQRLLYWREIERLPLPELALRTGATEPVLSTELWRARKLLQKEYQRRRFKDLLSADEEIFEHLDSLVHFNFTTAPEDHLRHLEAHERDYFERIAPTWDAYVASAYEAELHERLMRLLPWHREMTALDVGTGTGYLAGIVAPAVGTVLGVDCAPAMLAQAGAKMSQAGHQHVLFCEGMAERLPVASHSVDVAMCHMLLHHVVSPRTALAELRRVVRPGGYVLIIDAHAHTQRWTPQAFGDLHYGTNLRKLRKHVTALGMRTLHVEEAGISHSGSFIGNDATFSNFLLLAQVRDNPRGAPMGTHQTRKGA